MKVSPYVVAAALLLSGAGAVVAEPGEDGPRRRHESRAERVKEALGLSDEQQDKLKSLRRAHRDASSELRGKLKAAMRRLGDQLEDKATEKELAATLDSIASSRKALGQQREKFEKELSAVLTPTQRAKLLAGRMRMARGMGRGPGLRFFRARRHGAHEGMGGHGPRPEGPGGDEEEGD